MSAMQFLRNTGVGTAPNGYFHGKVYEILYYDGYPNTPLSRPFTLT